MDNLKRKLNELSRFPSENPNPVIRTDKNGKIIYANPASRIFFENWKQPEGLKLPVTVEKSIKKSSETGTAQRVEIANQDKIFLFSVVPINNNELINLYGMDITEQKHYENQIKKYARKTTNELRETQKELDDSRHLTDIGKLAANVAHELRNPLGVIKTAVYNIKRKNKDHALDKHLDTLNKKVIESEYVINNLLQYSKTKMPKYENINIKELIEDCIVSIGMVFNKQKNSILIEKSIIEDTEIKADGYQIKEVIINILRNAYQAMENQSGIIKIKGYHKENMYIVRISDTGEGIEKKIINKIFDPFFTSRSKGTGLGLAICNDVISLHKGTIDVQSTIGHGTTVTIEIPINP